MNRHEAAIKYHTGMLAGKKMECYYKGARVFNPSFNDLPAPYEVREVPRTIVIAGVKCEVGETKALEYGTFYWLANPIKLGYASQGVWDDTESTQHWLSCGLVHLSKEAAATMGKALAKAARGE